MASQTPGALRAEGLGTSMAHQMAAGAASLSDPRFDAHLQRGIQQSPCAPMGGVSTNDLPLPHSNGYSQGNHQNEPQYRYSLVREPLSRFLLVHRRVAAHCGVYVLQAASMGPSTLPPFVSQKASDALYDVR